MGLNSVSVATTGTASLTINGSGANAACSPLTDATVAQALQLVVQLLRTLRQGAPSGQASADGSGFASQGDVQPTSGAAPAVAPTGEQPGPSAPPSGGTSLEQAMSSTQAKDPTLFAKTLKDAKSGDGNALVEDQLKAYKEGAITKEQCIEEVKGAQGLANDHGGGKINKHVRHDAEDALGGNHIAIGQTRIAHAVVRGLETWGIGAIVKGIIDKTSKKHVDILTAAQPAQQQGTRTAMQHLASVDSGLADKLSADAKKGDGNAMVEDLVRAKAEQGAQGGGAFTDQDAQLIGAEVGDAGKGKVNDDEKKSFQAAFGADTLFAGSTRGAKFVEKVWAKYGALQQQAISPVTDGVAGMNDLAHGDVKGALNHFGQAAQGAVSDVAMVIAPEAAVPRQVALMGARTASGAASVTGAASRSALDLLKGGARAADKGNDAFNAVSGIAAPQQPAQ